MPHECGVLMCPCVLVRIQECGWRLAQDVPAGIEVQEAFGCLMGAVTGGVQGSGL